MYKKVVHLALSKEQNDYLVKESEKSDLPKTIIIKLLINKEIEKIKLNEKE